MMYYDAAGNYLTCDGTTCDRCTCDKCTCDKCTCDKCVEHTKQNKKITKSKKSK